MILRSLPPPLINPSVRSPTRSSLTLWARLEPLHQQELAQHLAEMIRRLRTPMCSTRPTAEHPGEEASNDHH